ncbi:MAG TPA: sialate O-acetylesterase [Paludibacter sp.]|nr:sialate O-acetylesterase [Paludibacter sp.]
MKLRSCIFLFFTLSVLAKAHVSMPKVFSSHMVLQRDMDIPIWGNAPAGTEITAQFGNTQTKGITDANGKWMLHLPKFKAGGPYKLVVSQTGKPGPKIVFDDVLVGDVWLASGQSNMELQVQQAKDAAKEIKQANYPNIRFFNVPHNKSVKLETDILGGSWTVCDSVSIRTVSAVAYYFARKIHTDINVPIGILQTTWGGTPVEAWTSKEMLLASPITRDKAIANDTVNPTHFVKDSLDLIRFWDVVYHPKNETDKIVTRPSYNDSKWAEVNMPSVLKTSGIPYYEGMIWLRKEIELPADFKTETAILHLGHPEMNYSVYINGNEICKTIWNASPIQNYPVPAKFIHSGKNLLSVRMAYLWGGGGFNPPANEMYITDGNGQISIAGNWKYMKDLEPSLPKIRNYHYYPSYLYNAMLNPVIPYGLKGFLWYQGEANDSLAYNYRTLFPMMITDWRIRWKQDYLPFLYVQLPNFKKRQAEPMESEWAELREAQAIASAQPNTGMVCAIDLGVAEDIHPRNKQDVGFRLALQAEKMVYGKQGIVSGPAFRSFRIEGNTIRISYSEIESGLKTKDNSFPREFTIAGADKKFFNATAQIQGNEIIVSSDKVPNPVAVRYAWSDNPDCNLINAEGFPAIPFRTDAWKGITQK